MKTSRFITLLLIILAGELIFALPFHITRFFRPTFLEVFTLSNSQLGDIFAIYGLVATLAYFPGGLIADRFPAHKLKAASLLATALGGVYLWTIPSTLGLKTLFGFWGLTTILLFWGAMIKATRAWGTTDAQGLAFGLLDGGRGLVASIFASIAVYIFGLYVMEALVSQETTKQAQGLKSVILFYAAATALTALPVWLMTTSRSSISNTLPSSSISRRELSTRINAATKSTIDALKDTRIWLQGGIVVAAYCGYKSLDNIGIYAVEVMGMSQIDSAKLATLTSYIRPIAAVLAGLMVDRFSASRIISILFLILMLGSLCLSSLDPSRIMINLIVTNLLVTFIAVYALRGVYFSLIEQSNIAFNRTGTAVGVISFVGFTPDIFFASITGRILDANPGFAGFQHYFLLITIFSLIGMIFSVFLTKKIAQTPPLPITPQDS